MSALKTLDMIRKTYKTILFLTVEGSENKEHKDRIRRLIQSTNGKNLNERDVETLASLSPEAYKVERLNVAVFSTGRARSEFKKMLLSEGFTEKKNAGLSEELSEALKSVGRLKPYSYEFLGVFTFDSSDKGSFIEFTTMVLSNKCPNVLVITDDKLNYLRKSGFFGREILSEYGMEEQTVIVQPFEYTEQLLKLLFIPTASPSSGAVVFTPYFSPLLRINDLKSGFRKAMKKSGQSASFFDENVGKLTDFVGVGIPGNLGDASRKLFSIIVLITDPSVFPMLAGYVDYAGLYGASQLIRGYTKSYYARLEDIESKVDLMIRGHLQKQYRMNSDVASALIRCYAKRNCSGSLRELYEQDQVLKKMLELLRTASSTRKLIYGSVRKSFEKALSG